MKKINFFKTAAIAAMIYSGNVLAQSATVEYNGYNNGSYEFETEDGKTYSFEEIEERIINQYDLHNNSSEGAVFEISYKIAEDAEGNDVFLLKALSPVEEQEFEMEEEED